jgi:hypothetical protein
MPVSPELMIVYFLFFFVGFFGGLRKKSLYAGTYRRIAVDTCEKKGS